MPAQPHPALRLAPVYVVRRRSTRSARSVCLSVCLSTSWCAAGASSEGHRSSGLQPLAIRERTMEAVLRAASSCSPSAGGDMFQSQASSAAPGTPPPAHGDWCSLQACDLVRQKQRHMVQ